METPRDHVDVVIEAWERERPDLDHSARALTMRISRCSRHLERAIDQITEPLGLDFCQYPVLSVLRRQGAPYRATPSELACTLILSSGAVTNRVDKLEQAGYVRRLPDPNDRRGVIVELTEEGLVTIDRAIETQVESESRLVSALDEDERDQLSALLHKLLGSLEDERGRRSARAA
jgi:DNA-binding MarR family transcriptional regulator